jgi:Fe-S-cluster containining protein
MSEKLPWYKEGLPFKCTGCGKCCSGPPGYVWVTVEEMEAMAAALKISMEEFTRQYVRRRNNRYALIEKKTPQGNYDCVFLEGGKMCRVYEARPTQCRTFPFWPENLTSEEAWMLAAHECEGINETATLIPYEEIEKIVATNDN